MNKYTCIVVYLLKLTLFLLGRESHMFVHLGVIFFSVFLKLLFLFLQDTHVVIVKIKDLSTHVIYHIHHIASEQ